MNDEGPTLDMSALFSYCDNSLPCQLVWVLILVTGKMTDWKNNEFICRWRIYRATDWLMDGRTERQADRQKARQTDSNWRSQCNQNWLSSNQTRSKKRVKISVNTVHFSTSSVNIFRENTWLRLSTSKLIYLYNFPIGPPHQWGRVYFPFLDSDVFDNDKDFRRFEHRFSMKTS